MKSGFNQEEILEPHKERKAFTVGDPGLLVYELNRMPFDLKGVLATFQRLIQYIME